MGIFNWFQKEVNSTPAERDETLTLHLLVRLVRNIDDRQQEHGRELAAIRAQQKVIIDKSNDILEFARATFPPRSEP